MYASLCFAHCCKRHVRMLCQILHACSICDGLTVIAMKYKPNYMFIIISISMCYFVSKQKLLKINFSEVFQCTKFLEFSILNVAELNSCVSIVSDYRLDNQAWSPTEVEDFCSSLWLWDWGLPRVPEVLSLELKHG
jgi:hypothetical protein